MPPVAIREVFFVRWGGRTEEDARGWAVKQAAGGML